jgi:protein gp37
MADRTKIEWADATWSPVTGCSKVSPGCANCYIERTPPFRIEGRRFERVGTEETTGVRLHPDRLDQPLHWRKPRRVFVCSMADLFHEQVPSDYIRDVFSTMARCLQHTFQVLTKRPERMRQLFPLFANRWAHYWWGGWPLPNVWVGVSIENARYTWRADVLREIPAAVRFISAEPLLGSLFATGEKLPGVKATMARRPLSLTGIGWVICGGESGPCYRPLDLDHAGELRDACQAAGVAYFFKQVGGRTPKSGGRLLDGRTWDETP